MCSWRWGFSKVWQSIKSDLPDNVKTQYVLGGLAPDSNEPMPVSMQHMLQQTWQRIETTIPGTQFNYDFWQLTKPRRSTYPSCRAVIAAKAQNDQFEEPMISAIQHAYYLNAQNPSDDDVLISLAIDIGCDATQFKESLNSDETHHELHNHLMLASKIGARGFPSLFIAAEVENAQPVALDHNNAQTTIDHINAIINANSQLSVY
jgi:putative protein-disulfide isomerase